MLDEMSVKKSIYDSKNNKFSYVIDIIEKFYLKCGAFSLMQGKTKYSY